MHIDVSAHTCDFDHRRCPCHRLAIKHNAADDGSEGQQIENTNAFDHLAAVQRQR